MRSRRSGLAEQCGDKHETKLVRKVLRRWREGVSWQGPGERHQAGAEENQREIARRVRITL